MHARCSPLWSPRLDDEGVLQRSSKFIQLQCAEPNCSVQGSSRLQGVSAERRAEKQDVIVIACWKLIQIS